MHQQTLIASACTLGAVILPITRFAQLLVGVLFGRTLGVLSSALLGSLAIWFLINFAWRQYTGSHVTLAVLAVCLLVIGVKALLTRGDAERRTTWALGAEAAAILLLGAYLCFTEPALRLV